MLGLLPSPPSSSARSCKGKPSCQLKGFAPTRAAKGPHKVARSRADEPAAGSRRYEGRMTARLEQNDAVRLCALDPKRAAEDADALRAAEGRRCLLWRLRSKDRRSDEPKRQRGMSRTYREREPSPNVSLLFPGRDRPDIFFPLDLDRGDGAEAAEMVVERLAQDGVGRALRQARAGRSGRVSACLSTSREGGEQADLAMKRPCGS